MNRFSKEVEIWLGNKSLKYITTEIDDKLHSFKVEDTYTITLDSKFGYMGIYNSLTTWEDYYNFSLTKGYKEQIIYHLNDYFNTKLNGREETTGESN